MDVDPAEVDLEQMDIDPEIAAQARTIQGSVVVMPVHRVDGRGVYTQSSILMVKRLRAAGVEAEFLDSADQRTFEVKKSIEALILTVVLGVASSAAWDGIKAFFRSRPKGRVSVTYVDLEGITGQRGTAWKVEGDSDAVLDAIDRLRSNKLGSSSSGELPARADSGSSATSFPASGSDRDIVDSYRRKQIEDRRAAAQALMQSAREAMEQSVGQSSQEHAEKDARAALILFARSLDWAEDTDEEEAAHRLMDEAGAWVRRTYGCRLARSGNEYRQGCPVALAHNRIGMSIGGTAVRVCSLCGGDFSECEHMPGTAYTVPGGNSDLGWCRVCTQDSCEHEASQQYRAPVVAIIKQMDVEEISLVYKPAHPEARIAEMSIPVSDLREALGDRFTPGMEVTCDRCLLPCEGLIKHDLP